jgi:L,D-peptidoglycan transpeptidase YkuD (ErfK/YbiS/YcfS/YnhG family)
MNHRLLSRRHAIAGGLLLPLSMHHAAAAAEQMGQAPTLLVYSDGVAKWGVTQFRCALGRNGVSRQKREGDYTTPAGSWPFRQLLYRADRLRRPLTPLPLRRLDPADGWSDQPDDLQYNRLVKLPRAAHAEQLWRNDHVYDLIVPVGYNDDPVAPGAGSAVFIHVARPTFSPTAGCVAFAIQDLLTILSTATTLTRLIVHERASQN